MKTFACSVIVCVFLAYKFVICMACGDGYFFDENRNCVPCPKHCLFCDSYTKCLSCERGYWGNVCEITCSKCKNGTSCEKTNGFCLEACLDGRSGILCDASCDTKCYSCNRTNISNCVKCAYGIYPPVSCDNVCSTCNNKTCDDNGRCISGCVKGYWGKNCKSLCSKHCLNEICGWKNGVCIDGCESNYAGSKCDEERSHNLVLIVILPAGGITILTVTVVVIWRKRRPGNNRSKEPETSEATEMINREPPEVEKTDGDALEKTKAVPGRVPSSTKPSKSKSKSKIFACCANKQGEENKTENSEEAETTVYGSIEQKQLTPGHQKLNNFATSIKRKRNADYQSEWKNISTRHISALCTECQVKKNRRTFEAHGICPYECNKVTVEGKKATFYFNASYIVEQSSTKKTYIACIGPTTEYIQCFAVFWRMVWQENCETIVMLNTLKKNEDEKYWPDKNTANEYSRITVKCENQEERLDYILRHFNLKTESETRYVTQFQYTAWPEKERASNMKHFLEFYETVLSETSKKSGPLVVHGRAGIGRTGTFIALDMLRKAAEDVPDSVDSLDEKHVDIQTCVEHLRRQRFGMVETVEQYAFLQEAFAQVIFNILDGRVYQKKQE